MSERSDQSVLVCEIIFMAMVSLVPGEDNSFCLTYLFCVCVSRCVCVDRGHIESQASPSSMSVLGTELRLPDLTASPCTCWASLLAPDKKNFKV